MKKTISVNRLAWKLLEELLESPNLYRVGVEKKSSGAIIVDAGIKAEGGFKAGKIITEICMGGCANAKITSGQYGDVHLPSIFVSTDHPILATLGSQYAGWQINEAGYFAIGSGPARALALKPKGIYSEINYKDNFDKAIVVLETDAYPPDKLLKRLASDCKIPSKSLAIILTPTASLAGATQVSGRIVETGIHKLRRLGLDPNIITHAWGKAPIPPIHPKFTTAMARTNDAILYGGVAYYSLEHNGDKELAKILRNAPSNASADYGRTFIEIFKDSGYDFYKIDPNLFAPAVILVNNTKTGTTFQNGDINAEALKKSFGLQRN